MKVFYTISPLLVLLPVILALPLQSASNAEADKRQTLQDKRQHEGRAYNVLAPTIDSNEDVHILELNSHDVATEQDTSGNPEPACIPLPHGKVSYHHHHQPNKQKVGGGVTNSNQTNSPAHAQSNSTVMPAVAPQPMAGPSPGQSPPPAPGTVPDPNNGGPPHQDLPPRQLAGRSDPPVPIPDNATPNYCPPRPHKLADHTHVNHTRPKGSKRPNYRPAALGSVALGHGPVVPGQPWPAASDSGSSAQLPPPGPERVHGQADGQGNNGQTSGQNNGQNNGQYNHPTKRQADGQGNGYGNNGTGNGQGYGQNATGTGVKIGPDDGNGHGSAFLGQQKSDEQNGQNGQQNNNNSQNGQNGQNGTSSSSSTSSAPVSSYSSAPSTTPAVPAPPPTSPPAPAPDAPAAPPPPPQPQQPPPAPDAPAAPPPPPQPQQPPPAPDAPAAPPSPPPPQPQQAPPAPDQQPPGPPSPQQPPSPPPQPQQAPPATDQQPPPAPPPPAPQQSPNTAPPPQNMTNPPPTYPRPATKHHSSKFSHSALNSTVHKSKTEIVQVVSNGFKKVTITSTAPNGVSVQSSKTLKLPSVPGLHWSAPGKGAGALNPVDGGVSLGADGLVVVKIGLRDVGVAGEGEGKGERRRRRGWWKREERD